MDQVKKKFKVSLLSVLFLSCGITWAADPNNGGAIYSKHCMNCHGDNGIGMMPGTPNFARGEGLFKPDTELATAIRGGRTVMPAFEGLLSESEIFDVIAYLRTMR